MTLICYADIAYIVNVKNISYTSDAVLITDTKKKLTKIHREGIKKTECIFTSKVIRRIRNVIQTVKYLEGALE